MNEASNHSASIVDGKDSYNTRLSVNRAEIEAEDAFQKKLRISFVKANRSKYEEIAGAIASGDIALAHRLVHTLKGNAGQIGKSGLQKAASEVEEFLKRMLSRSAT